MALRAQVLSGGNIGDGGGPLKKSLQETPMADSNAQVLKAHSSILSGAHLWQTAMHQEIPVL